MIVNAYDDYLKRKGSAAALVAAQQLMMVSAEFHTTNVHALTGAIRGQPSFSGGAGSSDLRRFKAVVFLYLGGGADTYNMLMPHSNCRTNPRTGKDVHAQYTQVRSDVALTHEQMLAIEADASTQPCGTFGVHHKLQKVKELYDLGQAAFISNVGNLIEPTTLTSYLDRSAKLPSQITAHGKQHSRGPV